MKGSPPPLVKHALMRQAPVQADVSVPNATDTSELNQEADRGASGGGADGKPTPPSILTSPPYSRVKMMIHSGPNISMFTDVLGQPSNTADHSVLPELEDIPKSLWATHDNNVGFIDCPPYKARLKHGTPVYCKQYPLSPDLHKRFTQDLRRINDIVVPITPLVPDVSAILTAIPAHHHFFTVEDICSLYQSTQTANHFSHLRFR
ncbi:hypothetical protein P4O66_004802, partial [Electrophorus voltai]